MKIIFAENAFGGHYSEKKSNCLSFIYAYVNWLYVTSNLQYVRCSHLVVTTIKLHNIDVIKWILIMMSQLHATTVQRY